jgi:uncharacterized protein YcfJ
MLMKAMTGLVASGLLLAAHNAQATDWHKKKYHGDAGYDYARVVDVDPIVHRVRVSTPRRECWTETRYEVVEHRSRGGHDRAAGPMILGGIIGAAVGNQIGRGDGRRAATVAGAIIGSAVGHDSAARRDSGRYEYTEERPYDVERCNVRYDETYEERIDGYHVTYIYNGRKFTTRMPYDPGERIRVRVDVHPAEYRY